jgi:tetratricopeptide (TPR) repeat protein
MVEKKIVEPFEVSSSKNQTEELQSSFPTLALKPERLGQNPSNNHPEHADVSDHAALKGLEESGRSFSETTNALLKPIINDPSIAGHMNQMKGTDTGVDGATKGLSGASYSPASISNVSKPRNGSIPTSVAPGFKHDLSQASHTLIKEDNKTLKRAAVTTIQAPDPKQKKHLASLEKFHRAAKERASIAKLVTQLEGAILRMDVPEVKKLIHRLSMVKGKDNLYVLNLKAFWYLKQKHYLDAEIVLQKILKLDQNHLEAGLNMAVVEVKTQRSDAALKRLKRLKMLYPKNRVLVEMIQKLS